MGCHFLLQCMKVKSESEVTQSCLTLRDPMDRSPPGSSVHGVFFQARVLEWGAIAFSGLVAEYVHLIICKWTLCANWNTKFCCIILLPKHTRPKSTYVDATAINCNVQYIFVHSS